MPYRPIRPSARTRVPGTVYMVHFPRPYKHAKHYVGWTVGPDLASRFHQHVTGHGSPLVYAACQLNGITTTDQLLACVSATWPGDRYLERKIKNSGGKTKTCPVCKKGADRNEVHNNDVPGRNQKVA